MKKDVEENDTLKHKRQLLEKEKKRRKKREKIREL